jgi:hypothetical protein
MAAKSSVMPQDATSMASMTLGVPPNINPGTDIRVRAAGAPPAPTDFASLPDYNQYLNMQKDAYENARTNNLAAIQTQQFGLEEAQNMRNQGAEGARRNLAGSFAKRGMMGGQGGAFSRAQDYQNAQLVASQTSTKAQVDALNRNFLANYGTGQDDWLTTGAGRGYKNQAIQQALAAAQNRIIGAQ